MDFHAKSIAQTLNELQTEETGLSDRKAKKRLETVGLNVLPASHAGRSGVRMFLDQFGSPLIILLLIAGTVSFFVGEHVEAMIIATTALINAVIGFFQEYKANQSLERLRSMVTYKAVVLRDGEKKQINSDAIVPGDILLFEAGDKIQADARLLSVRDFEVNEAALTGESLPVKKSTAELPLGTSLADRGNMVYRGTIAIKGIARAVVVATGEETELGHIATLVEETLEEQTPLQVQLSRIGKMIGILVVGVGAALFLFGLLVRGDQYDTLELFTTAVAVAVAAVPEGLAISLTVILAIGMQYILRRNALTRKLVAVETLGSVSVICTDKTGTLTAGQMEVVEIVTPTDMHQFPDGPLPASVERVLRMSILCNDGLIENPQAKEKDWKSVGDTTDTAILRAGLKQTLSKPSLETVMKRIDGIPFTSEAKLMATLHVIDHTSELYVKGAFEHIIARCSQMDNGDRTGVLTHTHKETLEQTHTALADRGLRVIAVAYRQMARDATSLELSDVNDLVFAGFIALSDPVRLDVKDTLEAAQHAGIRVIMVTGDHATTARVVGDALGFDTAQLIEGKEIDHLSDEELSDLVNTASIFARVDPKHKIRIVQALQKNGEVVAMTGDGVNDAPALKAADIGVALGSGTDVAKETADMVLLNDSFATIVAAVEEGRRIYQNIKKVLLYLFAGSFTEVLLIGSSLVLGLPLPLLAAQILWLNIIEESLPVMALAFDPGEKENMKEKPRKRFVPVFDRHMITLLLVIMIVSNTLLFSAFVRFVQSQDIDLTRTIIFAGIGVSVLTYIFSLRSLRKYVWQINPFSNLFLVGAVMVGAALLFSAVYLPALQEILHTVPLEREHWGLLILFSLCTMMCVEFAKYLFHHISYYAQTR